jgi:transposase
MDLRSIGPVGGQTLVNEVFYRDFDNRRQVGSYFGLVGTPYNSGARSREQGISKAGNRRARQLAVELAWLWTVHQPDSGPVLASRLVCHRARCGRAIIALSSSRSRPLTRRLRRWGQP